MSATIDNPFVSADDILTTDELAAILRIAPSTVDTLARRGDLGSVRFGRARRYLRADLVDYINRQRETSAP